MKRLLLAVVVLAAVGVYNHPANAQVSLGLRAGVNIANASLDPENAYLGTASKSSKTGFMIGAAAQFGLSDMISVQVEPMYAQKGFKIEGGGGTATVKLNQIEIPVLFKAKFGKGEVKPYVFAGPNVGIKGSSKVTVEGGGQTQDIDIDTTTASIDFGVDFGGGVEYAITPKVSIMGDVRYSLGLTDLDKSAVPAGGVDGSIKSNGIQFLIGVLFRIGS